MERFIFIFLEYFLNYLLAYCTYYYFCLEKGILHLFIFVIKAKGFLIEIDLTIVKKKI
jgi:hypothetical protein